MQAVLMRTFGEADVLRAESVADPEARAGWATVRLKAAALNWHDVLVRQGRYGSPLPHVIGADGAGVRVDTGEEVVVLPSLWWGDDESAPGPDFEILGDHRWGTYAELVRVPVDCLAPRPAGLSWDEAAALPLVGVTTYRGLFSRGRLRRGESLLVLGAGGGVATMAVSLASGVGARVVVTSSSPEKIAQAKGLGAAGGVLYTEDDWPDQARALSPGGAGFDLVLDSVGTWRDSLRCLRHGGRLVVLGASRSDSVVLEPRPFYFGQYELIGTTMGSPRDFAGLLALMDGNDIVPPPISATYPLDAAADAHRFLEAGAGFGKVVLTQP
ncbi:oxidoreductase [Intrasporangium chromatireducens Q5-1]|uniref:Oxidoreductase n=1 Tax=Intrasporangium chromatireducens Q5-1 TaxID=584657 RepID=W9GV86_9MICO|nr:zinc-binding dehydrogenase [Intrasporangium chromatireducens]EWT07789.1 oxidoreductase [Intrasporangium chromatireducens Q5-1]